MSELHPSSPAYWKHRWQEGRTGWDLGGLHPLFPELMAQASIAGLRADASIVEPGCGRAHTSAALAKSGFKTTAFDVSPEAIDAAKTLYGDLPNLTLTVADLFQPPSNWFGSFDAVYDRAVLCALPRDVRHSYVDTCVRVLKSGGLFLSLPFTKLHIAETDGPPFAIAEDQLTELLQKKFEKIYHHEVIHTEPDSKVAVELVAVWKKK